MDLKGTALAIAAIIVPKKKRVSVTSEICRFRSAYASRSAISAFVVEKSDPGVSFGAHEKKMGFRGSPTREVYFDDVHLSADRMLGAEGTGFALAMKTLDHTRITIAAQALGIAQGAFEVAMNYSHQRKKFGKEIFDFQEIQFMLAE